MLFVRNILILHIPILALDMKTTGKYFVPGEREQSDAHSVSVLRRPRQQTQADDNRSRARAGN